MYAKAACPQHYKASVEARRSLFTLHGAYGHMHRLTAEQPFWLTYLGVWQVMPAAQQPMHMHMRMHCA